MNSSNFSARVRGQHGLAAIDLAGDINAFAEEAINRAFAEAENLNLPVIVLNFAEVEYINSTGIALIIGLLGRSRKGGIKLLICGLSEHYQEIFRITRLADFIDIYPDESEALAHAAAGS